MRTGGLPRLAEQDGGMGVGVDELHTPAQSWNDTMLLGIYRH
jgi:hypothetical protein